MTQMLVNRVLSVMVEIFTTSNDLIFIYAIKKYGVAARTMIRPCSGCRVALLCLYVLALCVYAVREIFPSLERARFLFHHVVEFKCSFVVVVVIVIRRPLYDSEGKPLHSPCSSTRLNVCFCEWQ